MNVLEVPRVGVRKVHAAAKAELLAYRDQFTPVRMAVCNRTIPTPILQRHANARDYVKRFRFLLRRLRKMLRARSPADTVFQLLRLLDFVAPSVFDNRVEPCICSCSQQIFRQRPEVASQFREVFSDGSVLSSQKPQYSRERATIRSDWPKPRDGDSLRNQSQREPETATGQPRGRK